MCVQRFDDSLNSAIHTTYRISLRSSSMREPRDPLLKVLTFLYLTVQTDDMKCKNFVSRAGTPAGEGTEIHAARKQQVRYTEGFEMHIPKNTYLLVMILPQVHLRKPCYDFYFL
jgi:hypothetical protein